MADETIAADHSSVLRTLTGPFASRPRLVSGFGVGLLAFAVSGFLLPDLAASTRAIVSWDLTCLWFVGLTMGHMRTQSLADLKAHVGRA